MNQKELRNQRHVKSWDGSTTINFDKKNDSLWLQMWEETTVGTSQKFVIIWFFCSVILEQF